MNDDDGGVKARFRRWTERWFAGRLPFLGTGVAEEPIIELLSEPSPPSRPMPTVVVIGEAGDAIRIRTAFRGRAKLRHYPTVYSFFAGLVTLAPAERVVAVVVGDAVPPLVFLTVASQILAQGLLPGAEVLYLRRGRSARLRPGGVLQPVQNGVDPFSETLGDLLGFETAVAS